MKSFKQTKVEAQGLPTEEWDVLYSTQGECLSYLAVNHSHREFLWIDPVLPIPGSENAANSSKIFRHPVEWKNYTCLGVIDTHTHADHISAAAQWAEDLKAPLLMHHLSPSRRVHLRIAHETRIPSQAGSVRLILTPGHTPDGICVEWGPFVFTGDTVLYGDVGRDDLPGGNPAEHYESLESLKRLLSPQALIFPGHDEKGGRFSSWEFQLQINSSLTQDRESYIREASEFDAPAPRLFKRSLVENFK